MITSTEILIMNQLKIFHMMQNFCNTYKWNQVIKHETKHSKTTDTITHLLSFDNINIQ